MRPKLRSISAQSPLISELLSVPCTSRRPRLDSFIRLAYVVPQSKASKLTAGVISPPHFWVPRVVRSVKRVCVRAPVLTEYCDGELREEESRHNLTSACGDPLTSGCSAVIGSKTRQSSDLLVAQRGARNLLHVDAELQGEKVTDRFRILEWHSN